MKKIFEVAYVAYHLDGTWTDEVFFRGTKEECQAWLETNCARSEYPGETQYWMGNKKLEIFKAEN